VFQVEINPIWFQFFFWFNHLPSFHSLFAMPMGCSKSEHSWQGGFVALAPNMSRMTTRFTYLHLKLVFVVQM
jgi:hypothetical protein